MIAPVPNKMWLLRAEPRCDSGSPAIITNRPISGNPDALDCAHHYEQMLYDNPQLASVYLHALILNSYLIQAVTGNRFFRTIIQEILH